jgi:hypothetical protein
LSSQHKDNQPVRPTCEWQNLCSNDLAAGVTINTKICNFAGSINAPISDHETCHLWGSDGSHQQMLFIYLLRLTQESLTLHYFNDSYSSQQYSSRQQLCAANNNFEIVQMIYEGCMQNSLNMESLCCSEFNVSINFNEGNTEVKFVHDFIEIPVDYLDCTSKS